MYDGLRDLVARYDQHDRECLFFAFVQNTYVDSLVMGIRRQIKCDDNCISLARLLRELHDSPQLVTRDDYCALWPAPGPLSRASIGPDFSLFADAGAAHIDAARVDQDLRELNHACGTAVELADRRVAHRDRRGLTKDPTMDELVAALEVAGRIAKKYYLLFTATDVELHPVPTTLPWPRPWLDLAYAMTSRDAQQSGPKVEP
jgi:hypothetical protein